MTKQLLHIRRFSWKCTRRRWENQLRSLSRSKTTSDIENAVLDNHSAIVYGIVGAIIVETEEMTNAFVYDMTGSLIKTVTINAGSNTIPVAGNGLYLIKVGNAAYKTIVK